MREEGLGTRLRIPPHIAAAEIDQAYWRAISVCDEDDCKPNDSHKDGPTHQEAVGLKPLPIGQGGAHPSCKENGSDGH